MPNIQNIPDKMIEDHIAWHRKHHGSESGEEFLIWHGKYIDHFNSWIASLEPQHQPRPETIQPWTAIPEILKGVPEWTPALVLAEQHLQNMMNFSTRDDLGRHITRYLHGFLHGAAAEVFNEPQLMTFESPRSTYFWQLHGLIEHWHQQWIAENQARTASA